MKKNNYIGWIICFSVLLQGCQSEDNLINNPVKGELELLPYVESTPDNNTRALGDEFFVTGDKIWVELTTSGGGSTVQTFQYTYGNDRIFRGSPGYRFSTDDEYIVNLSAKWPGDDVRSQGLITDQRLLENYKRADWISGGQSNAVGGIVPTDAPVPLIFHRENVMLEFELVGQNVTGLNIEELLIELQSTGDEGGAKAFWAYCGKPNGHAELILEDGSQILSPDNYLIGRIKVTGQSNDFTIIFPKTNITLKGGYRYLVTLTPQGYFMTAFINIAGFATGEGGIAIPFEQPVPDQNGNFNLENPAQLISLSWLVRNYDDGRSFVWSQRNYKLDTAFTMTSEWADRYIPIPSSMFAGVIQDSIGQRVDSITYEGNKVLQLFSNDNQ